MIVPPSDPASRTSAADLPAACPASRTCAFRWQHCLAVSLFWLIILPSAHGQFAPLPLPGRSAPEASAEFERYRRLPRDPLTLASYIKAVQALKNGEVTPGLETLQAVLDEDSDFFILEPGQAPQSLFEMVTELIKENRDEYERLFGPTANQLLAEAQKGQNRLALEELVRRFALTNAGLTALRELAALDRDRGEPALAARDLEQLARHPGVQQPRDVLFSAARLLARNGNAAAAKSLLQRHPAQFPDPQTALGELSSDSAPQIVSAANARIYEWRTPYGDVHQSGQTAPAPALQDFAWQSALIDAVYDFPALMMAPEVSEQLADENRALSAAIANQVHSPHSSIAMPSGRPLIVNNLVIASGEGSVKAFDLRTGKLAWNGVDIDETFDYLAKQTYSAGEAHDPVREEMRELFTAIRGWRDLTSGALSTDGHQVYAISNCQLVGTTSPARMMQNLQRHALLPQRSNLLTAYDLSAGGKKRWSVGTLSEFAPMTSPIEQREIFFLGPPLPVDEHLYALGEERGQVQLFELDPATGEVVWSLGLLNPDQDLVTDEARRLAGLMPAFGAGLLICPTGEGSLTAVDPVRRQVVWTYVYADASQPMRNQAMFMRMMRPQHQSARQSRDELLDDQRWFDSRVMIAQDTVVFTPPDSEALICLNLLNGTPAWAAPMQRMQMLCAAAIFENSLILVGRSEIKALRLSDGTSVWPSSVPIPEPSGRGVRMGDQFLQPLKTGEIAVIDLKAGRLLTRLPVPDSVIPGNLVADQGVLAMQTGTGVKAFRSRKQIEQEIADGLKENPSDQQALALRGEWRLQLGELKAGLEDLKTAEAASPISRRVLAWSLLDGLRTDFASYRKQAAQIEATLQGPEQRLMFLRIFAEGLQRSGETAAALSQYLKILEILPTNESLHDFDSDWAATDSRWVLARIGEILSTKDHGSEQRLRTIVKNWVRDVADIKLLLRILPAFPAFPVDSDEHFIVLQRLADEVADPSQLHNREAILRDALNFSDPSTRARAAAQLLTLALQYKDAKTAREMLPILEEHDQKLLGQRSGTSFERAASVRQNAEYADLLHHQIQWPAEIHVEDDVRGSARTSTYQIPLLGPPSEALEGWTFFLDQGGVNVEIYDQDGQHRSRIPTSFPGVRYAVETDLSRYVCMRNHLVLIVLIDRFLVIDLLSDPDAPQLLVKKEFLNEEENVFNGRGPIVGPPRVGLRSMQMELRNGQMGANVGPLTDSVLCYGSGSDLIAINPITGEEFWRRRDMPVGAEILGDERYLIVKPADGTELQILNALDGSPVGTCPLPEGAVNCLERRNGDWGRFIPVVEEKDEKLHWTMFDPVTNNPWWRKEVSLQTRWTTVNGRHIAFYEPEKQELSIRSGTDAHELLKAQILLEQTVEQFSVLEFPDQWVFASSDHPSGFADRQSLGVHAHEMLLAPVNGTVLAWGRAKDKLLWSEEITDQELVTQGPVRWPLLLFGKGRGRMASMIVDRRNGEVIRRKLTTDDGSGISWQTETQPLRVHLKFAQDRVSLQFGAAETPTAPPHPDIAPPQQE